MNGNPKTNSLQRVLCISYSVYFERDLCGEIRALSDSWSNVNAIIPVFIAKLSFSTRLTVIDAQKIDGSAPNT